MRILFTFALYLVLAVPAGIGQGKPSIQIETRRNAGTVSQGDVIKQVFSFTNTGSGPLEISVDEHG